MRKMSEKCYCSTKSNACMRSFILGKEDGVNIWCDTQADICRGKSFHLAMMTAYAYADALHCCLLQQPLPHLNFSISTTAACCFLCYLALWTIRINLKVIISTFDKSVSEGREKKNKRTLLTNCLLVRQDQHDFLFLTTAVVGLPWTFHKSWAPK